MPKDAFQYDQNVELEALRELVDAILLTDYRDSKGVSLRNNEAFLSALALVELYETMRNAPRD